MRKSVTIATKSRRGIRLNWNERYQGKREIDKGIFTVTRRLLNKHERREAKYIIRAFRGLDWDELLFPVKTRETRDSDNW